MEPPHKRQQPLAEVFGFAIADESQRAQRYRHNKLCPFNNIISNCTKNSIEFPLGVCSVYHRGNAIIVCPVRFREDWRIISDAAAFIFDSSQTWAQLSEIKLKDKFGKAAGNIDYVLVAYDDKGRILDFGTLEVQSVYISGNLMGPFTAYMEHQSPNFTWTNALKSPKPDYLSSSRKRLIPQIIAKGSILRQWGKKQVIALQTNFYNTLPELPEIEKSEADLAFLLYDLVPSKEEPRLELKLSRVVYTKFIDALQRIGNFEAGLLTDFVEILQQKLNIKRSINKDTDNSETIIQ